jgi:hypothetical protein
MIKIHESVSQKQCGCIGAIVDDSLEIRAVMIEFASLFDRYAVGCRVTLTEQRIIKLFVIAAWSVSSKTAPSFLTNLPRI